VNESFLYYIWQFQYFDKKELFTTAGERIEVFNPGILNHHAGPDFANSSVRIDGIAWAGSVEIHTWSSDWTDHKHNYDGMYENVILHVVWEEDRSILRLDKTLIPTLELKDRVEASLVRNYQKLIHNPFSIPCTKSFPSAEDLIKHAMLDRALLERLEAKADEVVALLKRNNNDWEETVWQMLTRNFGFKVNSEPFQQLGKSLSYKIILKHADKPFQIDALLFGQAGFLDGEVGDSYYQLLKREYQLLAGKYSLLPGKLAKAQWRFLRLRPANFPTVRLAQFSSLVQQRSSLFSRILEAEDTSALVKIFSVRQSEYWREHYRFNKRSKATVPEIGISSVENILINSVVPLLVAWGKYNDDQSRVDRALEILHSLTSESNEIIRTWELLGYKSRTAFDSQGLIELYNNYCKRRNCLTCAIGAALLKPNKNV